MSADQFVNCPYSRSNSLIPDFFLLNNNFVNANHKIDHYDSGTVMCNEDINLLQFMYLMNEGSEILPDRVTSSSTNLNILHTPDEERATWTGMEAHIYTATSVVKT